MSRSLILIAYFVYAAAIQLEPDHKELVEEGYSPSAPSKWFGYDCACFNPAKSISENANGYYCSCDSWFGKGSGNRCQTCCGAKPAGYRNVVSKTEAATICASKPVAVSPLAAASKWFGDDCACFDQSKSISDNANGYWCSCDSWFGHMSGNRCQACCGAKPAGYKSDASKVEAANICAKPATASKWFGDNCACFNPSKSISRNANENYCSCDKWFGSMSGNRCESCCGAKPAGYNGGVSIGDAASICAKITNR